MLKIMGKKIFTIFRKIFCLSKPVVPVKEILALKLFSAVCLVAFQRKAMVGFGMPRVSHF